MLLIIFLFNQSCLLSQKVDYSDSNNWAALPEKFDHSDLVPGSEDTVGNDPKNIDVFFIYPTSYTGEKIDGAMNIPLSNDKIRIKTDENAIKYQASLFNRVGNVYAPYYKQAHISVYFDGENELKKEALNVAYNDVRSAFLYYLNNYNHGKPFILAGHSQGATHLKRLIKEEIEGRPAESKLIVAYIVGMPVFKGEFELKPCIQPEQIGCFCSWRTFLEGYKPEYVSKEPEAVVTNPISWKDDANVYTKPTAHQGAVLIDFKKAPIPKILQAKVEGNVLWITKPDIKGKLFLTRKNYHIGDFNLFYKDIQENAKLRSDTYLTGLSN